MKLIDAYIGLAVEVQMSARTWRPGVVVARDFIRGYVSIKFTTGALYQIMMPCEDDLELPRVRIGRGLNNE